MAPKLELAFTLRTYVNKNISDIGPVKGASGPLRRLVPITHGSITFANSSIQGKVLGPGADWVLQDVAGGIAHLDIRTHANGALYLHYPGILSVDIAAAKVLGFAADASTTEFGDNKTWFTTPVIETSDEGLKWMESAVFVGQGRWVVDENGNSAEYAVYKVVN